MKESLFDRLVGKTENDSVDTDDEREGPPLEASREADIHPALPSGSAVKGEKSVPGEDVTPEGVKAAVQELMKYGILEVERKSRLFETVLTRKEQINRILEPLDLLVTLDEVRGLAFLTVAKKAETMDDQWKHPLVRRQRLTLEQSLLVAILRQHYITHEQNAGIGAGEARLDLDELLPQLSVYLGELGSDLMEEKRLRNLLEKLKGHGIVSDVDANGMVSIRPIITHLANPETLQILLNHFKDNAQ